MEQNSLTLEAQKLFLLKSVSKIHADNCNNTLSYDKAVHSYNQVSKIRDAIIKATSDKEILSIMSEISTWTSVDFEFKPKDSKIG